MPAVRRKKTIRSGAEKPTAKPTPVGLRKIRAVLSGLHKAHQLTAARGEELLRTCHLLGDAAVRAEMDRLTSELRDQKLLRDIVGLQEALQECSRDVLPPALESFRLLPEAILEWFDSRFGLKPYLTSGQQLEIPRERLSAFQIDGEMPDVPADLVHVRVVAPGWKRHGKTFVLPSIVVESECSSQEPVAGQIV